MKDQATLDVMFLTSKQAANLLSISLPTLRKYRKAGIIPAHQLGNRILYLRNEVLEAVIKGKADKVREEQ